MKKLFWGFIALLFCTTAIVLGFGYSQNLRGSNKTQIAIAKERTKQIEIEQEQETVRNQFAWEAQIQIADTQVRGTWAFHFGYLAEILLLLLLIVFILWVGAQLVSGGFRL